MEQYQMINSKDIKDFLSGLMAFFRKCLGYLYAAIKQHILFFLLIFLLIGGTGMYRYFTGEAYYESDMACGFNYLHQKTYGEMIKKLNILTETKSYTELAEALNLSPEDAKAIISLKAKNIAGSNLDEDITVAPTHLPFYISVKARNKEIFAPLQTALLNYMNNTPMRHLRENMERARIDQKIKYVGRDLDLLDSVIASFSGNGSAIDSLNGVTALFAYKDKLEDRILQEENAKSLLQSTELLHGFMPPSKPVKDGRRSLFLMLGMGLAGGCVGSVLLKIMKDEQ